MHSNVLQRENPKMTWTKEDQRALDELLERKQNYTNTITDNVRWVVEAWYWEGMSADEVLDALIARAEVLRKALEPFTKGPL